MLLLLPKWPPWTLSLCAVKASMEITQTVKKTPSSSSSCAPVPNLQCFVHRADWYELYILFLLFFYEYWWRHICKREMMYELMLEECYLISGSRIKNLNSQFFHFLNIYFVSHYIIFTNCDQRLLCLLSLWKSGTCATIWRHMFHNTTRMEECAACRCVSQWSWLHILTDKMKLMFSFSLRISADLGQVAALLRSHIWIVMFPAVMAFFSHVCEVGHKHLTSSCSQIGLQIRTDWISLSCSQQQK